jgi:nitrite reductase/ring-hydroxylating ferredoxin subunit
VAALSDARDRICGAQDLVDGGAGVRFTVSHGSRPSAAFAVRYRGRVYAYLNRCAHKFTELDWDASRFFDAEGRYLICATHGALYEPASGICVAGPCRGARLVPLMVQEVDQHIRLVPMDGIHLVAGTD